MKSIKKLKLLLHIWKYTFKAYLYDARRYVKYAGITDIHKYSQQRLTGYIITRYHIIEKGLAMPEMRFSFGIPVIESLIHSCNLYFTKYGNDNCQVNHAVDVLNEYVEIHHASKIDLVEKLINGINELKLKKSETCSITNNHIYTQSEYFSNNISPFPEFAKSRHSLRHFSTEDVSVEDLKKSITLAQETTPTSCNRQSVRVHLVTNKTLIEKALNIQTGNRGFGHLTNKLIVLSSEVSVYNEIRERNLPYIDSGIYAMNLLYALHYFEIGACALNWSANVNDDIALHEILNIPESETITLIIACGVPNDKFKLASSKRFNFESITQIH